MTTTTTPLYVEVFYDADRNETTRPEHGEARWRVLVWEGILRHDGRIDPDPDGTIWEHGEKLVKVKQAIKIAERITRILKERGYLVVSTTRFSKTIYPIQPVNQVLPPEPKPQPYAPRMFRFHGGEEPRA